MLEYFGKQDDLICEFIREFVECIYCSHVHPSVLFICLH